MKIFPLIILMTLSYITYSQNIAEYKIIQNFYTTCKAEKYTAYNLMNTGIQLFETKQYSRSINKFNKSLEKDSTLCDSWYLIGYSYQQLAEYKKSIEYCNKSLDKNAENISAHIIMGYSSIYLNDTLNALKNFNRAKDIAPEKIDPYYGIALIKYWQKDYESAMNEILEFEKKKGNDTEKKDIKTLNKLKEKIELEN